MVLRADLVRGIPQQVGRDTFARLRPALGRRLRRQQRHPYLHPAHRRRDGCRTSATSGSPTSGRRTWRPLTEDSRTGTEAEAFHEAPTQGPRHLDRGALCQLGQYDLPGRTRRGADRQEPGQLQARRSAQGREIAKRVKPFSIWNVDELTRFCDWALAEDEPWARAWVILSRTGLRSGEVLALRWGDLDFNRNEMRIERALHYDESLPLARALRDRASQGRPAAHGHLRQDLRRRLLQDWRRELPGLLAGGTGNVTPMGGLRSSDPVFPSTHGRTATQSGLHAAFLRVQKHYRQAHPDLDLPRLTVHELRHTHASLLFEAGQSVKVVQERLGHASAQVTLNTYAHLLHDAQTRAAAALDDLLAGGRQRSTGTDSGSD